MSTVQAKQTAYDTALGAVQKIAGSSLLDPAALAASIVADDKLRITGRELDIARATDVTGAMTNVWRTVGGQASEQSYAMKHLALTDSKEYMRQRSAAVDKVKSAVTTNFNTKLEAYLESGASREDAEAAAKKSATAQMNDEMHVLRLQFGESEDSIVTDAASRSSGNMFTGAIAPKMSKK